MYHDPAFYEKMAGLFSGSPTCRLLLPTLEAAFDRIRELEQKVTEMEKRVERMVSFDG